MTSPPGWLQMRNMIGVDCHWPAVELEGRAEREASGEVEGSKTRGPGVGVARGQVLDRIPANLALMNLDPETRAPLKPATDLRNRKSQSRFEGKGGKRTYTP